ncbi:MAG: serine hydrolase [Gemmatimonadota bacterium]
MLPALHASLPNRGSARPGRAGRWAEGFSFADVAGGTPATPETVFHIASLTKTFASIVLLQLAAQGSISLDDPVSAYGIQLSGDVRVGTF